MNNFFAKLKFYAIKKFDYLFVKYLTVERGGGRRKFIWKTQNFREATQIHLPKLIFVIFSIVVIWKINDKIKSSIRKKDYYTTKSLREEIAYEEQQVTTLTNLSK